MKVWIRFGGGKRGVGELVEEGCGKGGVGSWRVWWGGRIKRCKLMSWGFLEFIGGRKGGEIKNG